VNNLLKVVTRLRGGRGLNEQPYMIQEFRAHSLLTLLTLHEPRSKAFCKQATAPVDRYDSQFAGENRHKCCQLI